MHHCWKSYVLGALVGVGLALAGCSQSPLAPGEDTSIAATSSSLAPPIVSFGADGTVGYVPAPIGFPTGTSTVHLATALPTAVAASASIDGNKGGTVRAGRFSVKVPSGAYAGLATVTVSMPDSTVMICDLSISPMSANKFKVPVQLTADLSDPTLTDATGYTNYWFDPSRQLWLSLASKSRCSGTLVTTSLDHFSTYASGKAGW